MPSLCVSFATPRICCQLFDAKDLFACLGCHRKSVSQLCNTKFLFAALRRQACWKVLVMKSRLWMSWKDLLLAGTTTRVFARTFMKRKSLLCSCGANHMGGGGVFEQVQEKLSLAKAQLPELLYCGWPHCYSSSSPLERQLMRARALHELLISGPLCDMRITRANDSSGGSWDLWDCELWERTLLYLCRVSRVWVKHWKLWVTELD
jgi:hypothetical protein